MMVLKEDVTLRDHVFSRYDWCGWVRPSLDVKPITDYPCKFSFSGQLMRT